MPQLIVLPRRLRRLTSFCAAVALLTACAGPPAASGSELPLSDLELPPGFTVDLFARSVPGARDLALGAKGTVFVGTNSQDHVWALVDRDGDGHADSRYRIGSGLHLPNGVAFRNGSLYVGEVSRILRFDDIEIRLANPPPPVVVYDRLPTDQHHGLKVLAFGPDGWLYVPVGMPCNVCEKADPIYGTIQRMKPDGSRIEPIAHGIRNSVGYDWQPGTGRLWFTDNGRDWLGDNRPPDELNEITRKGENFGFPYCHGGFIPDPEFGRLHACSEFTPPARRLGPHVAPLGMHFYTGTMFPEAYRGDILIAEHGSWNRSTPIGYRITRVRVEGSKALSYDVFISGWLRNGKAWGRPVALLELEDGSLLISDDRAGVIYRVTYTSGSGPR